MKIPVISNIIEGRQQSIVLREENTELRTELEIRQNNMGIVEEALAELELSLEDRGWSRLGDSANREFTRSGLNMISYMARIYFLKNPLIRRAVLTQTQFVWGQGVNIAAKHPMVDEVVQAFLDDTKNKQELTRQQAYSIKESELQCFGNIFFVFFPNKYTGSVRVRTIPMDEITEIVCNPEDNKEPWYYGRSRTVEGLDKAGRAQIGVVTDYYPDWRYDPQGGRTSTWDGKVVHWESPVYHVATNKLSDMKFGVSEIYSALDWAKAYKEFLENWATMVKAYARFAWSLKTKGGQAAVDAAKTKLNTTRSSGNGETNPPPNTGSAAVMTDGVTLNAMNTGGAQTKAEDGKYLRQMVSSATGIFEHYLSGDPSTGNLATAKSMEYPMLMMFRERQQLWTNILLEIVNYVVDWGIRARWLPGRFVRNRYGEMVAMLADDKDNEDPEKRTEPIDRTVTVTFPDILEQSITERIEAIVKAATLDGKALAGTLDLKTITKMLLEALGMDDIDELMAILHPEDEEEPDPADTNGKDGDDSDDDGKDPSTVEEQFKEAMTKLTKDIAEALASDNTNGPTIE